MSVPRVSVVVTAFDRAALLDEALRSVVTQTFDDLEIIVVDDCSPTNLEPVADSLGDMRIRYVRHAQNRGLAAARNTGISNARAELIAFLDDDDAWLPTKLAKQLNRLEAAPDAGLVYCGHRVAFETLDNNAGVYRREKEGWVAEDLLRENLFSSITPIVRRRCFELVGNFDQGLPRAQDWDMWIRIAERFRFVCVPEPLAVYRQHRGQSFRKPETVDHLLQFFAKHRSKIEALPPRKKHLALAHHAALLGTLCIESGQYRRGRRWRLDSIRHDPLSPRNYARLLGAFRWTAPPYLFLAPRWRGFLRRCRESL